MNHKQAQDLCDKGSSQSRTERSGASGSPCLASGRAKDRAEQRVADGLTRGSLAWCFFLAEGIAQTKRKIKRNQKKAFTTSNREGLWIIIYQWFGSWF